VRLLICIVAALMSGHFSGPSDGGTRKQTEFRKAFFSEGIHVPNFPNGIDRHSPCKYVRYLSLCEGNSGRLLYDNDAIWTERYRAKMHAGVGLDRMGIAINSNPDPMGDLIRGSLPEIFYDQFDLWSLPRVHAIYERAIDKNIRAQLPSGGSNHDSYGDNKSYGLAGSSNRDNPSNDLSPPFGRRLILLFSFGLGGFLIALFGGLQFDDQRQLLGATLFIGGFLLLVTGLGLWCATGYPSTWGWWL
jgi:hypothetical protein